jgi:hypothetical protein
MFFVYLAAGRVLGNRNCTQQKNTEILQDKKKVNEEH